MISVCAYIDTEGRSFRRRWKEEGELGPPRFGTPRIQKILCVSIDWLLITQDKFAFDLSVEIEEMKDES
jgi:hypothetical protein